MTNIHKDYHSDESHNGVKTYGEAQVIATNINEKAKKSIEQLQNLGITKISIQESTENILSNKKYDQYNINFKLIDELYKGIISNNTQINNYAQFANDRIGDALLSIRMLGSKDIDKIASSFSYICYVIGNLIENNKLPEKIGIIESNYITILKEMISDLNLEKVRKYIGEIRSMNLLENIKEIMSELDKKVIKLKSI